MVGRGSAVRPYPCYAIPQKIQPRNSGLARPELRDIVTNSNRSPPNCARFTRSIYGLAEISSYPKLSHANLPPAPVPQKSQPLRGCSAAIRGVKGSVFDCKNRGDISMSKGRAGSKLPRYPYLTHTKAVAGPPHSKMSACAVGIFWKITIRLRQSCNRGSAPAVPLLCDPPKNPTP